MIFPPVIPALSPHPDRVPLIVSVLVPVAPLSIGGVSFAVPEPVQLMVPEAITRGLYAAAGPACAITATEVETNIAATMATTVKVRRKVDPLRSAVRGLPPAAFRKLAVQLLGMLDAGMDGSPLPMPSRSRPRAD